MDRIRAAIAVRSEEERISTSSFIILSAGLALLGLALGYWLIDMARIRKGAPFFLIVGMNPIFIYLFALSGGGDWLCTIVAPFTMSFAAWMGNGPAQAGPDESCDLGIDMGSMRVAVPQADIHQDQRLTTGGRWPTMLKTCAYL